MNDLNANTEVAQHLLKYVGKGFGALKNTSLGKRILSVSSYPLFFAKALAKNPEQIQDEFSSISAIEKKEPEPEKNFLEKVKDIFVKKVAVGDLLSISGLGMYLLQNNVGPEKPGIIGSMFRNLSLLLTFMGSTTAAIGRALGFDKEYLYGEDYAEQMLKEAQNLNKPIFNIWDSSQRDPAVQNFLNTLQQNANRLDKLLIYRDGMSESILERHEQKSGSIGGLFDGAPGIGKTAGAKCIMGKWVNKVIREGDIPVLAELNLANFDEYIAQQRQSHQDTLEFFEYLSDEEGNTKGNFATNQGLMVLELLIRKIQKIKSHVEKYNAQSDGPKKRLVIFADEFDKALQTRTLKGCDKSRLRNLLIQFNELFMDQDILLTSNTKLEDMMTELEQHVKIDDTNTGKTEVINPMADRLTAKNRCSIELPGPLEQAKIIASRILTDYQSVIDWSDFSSGQVNSFARTANFEYDRDRLAEIIHNEITANLNIKINGRQLENACEQLKSLLLGKARKINAEKHLYNDEQWQKLSAQEKISATKALIDKAMVKSVVGSKLLNLNLDLADRDLSFAFDISKRYLNLSHIAKVLRNKNLKLTLADAQKLEAILEQLYDKRVNANGTVVYQAKNPVTKDGVKYQHAIIKQEATKEHAASYNLAYAVVDNKDLGSLTMYDFISTKRFTEPELANQLNSEINRLSVNQFSRVINDVTKLLTTNGRLDEAKLNKVASQAVQHLASQQAF